MSVYNFSYIFRFSIPDDNRLSGEWYRTFSFTCMEKKESIYIGKDIDLVHEHDEHVPKSPRKSLLGQV